MIDAGKAFSGNERHCVFLNTRDGKFADISAGSGLDFAEDGRAVAVTDWDQDGDLDLWISNRNAPRLRLLRNEGDRTNHHLSLRLRGTLPGVNRDAIGSRVELVLKNNAPPLIQTLRGGEGFLAQSSKWVHFGLGPGPEAEIASINVRWPNGERESFPGVPVDSRYLLDQGSGVAETVAPPPRTIALEHSAHPSAPSTSAARIPVVSLLRAPKLNIRNSQGQPLTKQSLLVNFWASWCAPCQVELGTLRDRADDLRAAGLQVLALSVDELDPATAGDPARVIAKLKFPFPSTKASVALVAAFQEFHDNLVGLNRPLPVPTSFLIDPDGHIAVIYKGPLEVDQLLADLAHSRGSLDDRLRGSAQLPGSLVSHPVVARSRLTHEATSQLRIALARRAANDLEGAAYYLASARRLDPSYAPAAKELASLYLDQQEHEKAAKLLKTYLKLEADDLVARHHLAKLLAHLGQIAEANREYVELLGRDPKIGLAHFEYAHILAQTEPAAAVSRYKTGLALLPDNKFAANNLAWLLATHPDDRVRNPAEALAMARKLDTWMNFDPEQGVNISGKAGGGDLGQLAFTNGPILNDGTTVSGTVEISYDPVLGASFTTTGLVTNADFVDVDTGAFVPNDDYTFNFSARVGGANEDLFIDNLIIRTGTPGDRDGDGLSDAYEIANGLDPDDDGTVGESSPGAKDGPNGALGDPDGDSLTNTEERELGTDPQNDDTDGDGLKDGVEDGGGVYVSNTQTGTDPLVADSDADGLSDGVENPTLPFVDASQPGTDPNNADTDGDGVNDGEEIQQGRNPTSFDAPPTSYQQNFDGFANGTTDLNDGSVIAGAAASVEDGQLRLTIDGQALGFSSFSIPGLAGSSDGWTATFDITLIDGPGANEPADGFSFNYGNGPLGILGNAEEGIGAGIATENLSFEVDTWMNLDGEQGVNISGNTGGADVGQLAFTNGPILLDGTTVSGTVEISWNPTDGASFTTTGLNTNADFVNIATTFVPADSHTFIISARVGGANQTLLIDNLLVTTAPLAKPQFGLKSIGGDLEFTFDSNAGKFYDILSSTNPEADGDPGTWAVWQADIVATPPQNVETFTRPGDAKRFFVILEKNAPPLFTEDFESGQGDWTTGVNDGNGNTTWQLGTPAGTTGPTSGAGGSANAFTTNLGDYAPDADIFLRSPDIALTAAGISGAILSFEQFRDADGFADLGVIRILRSGDLTELGTIDPDLTLIDADWASFSVDLPAAAVGETIIIEFNFTSDVSVDDFSGWSIDNVEVGLN